MVGDRSVDHIDIVECGGPTARATATILTPQCHETVRMIEGLALGAPNQGACRIDRLGAERVAQAGQIGAPRHENGASMCTPGALLAGPVGLAIRARGAEHLPDEPYANHQYSQ